MAFEAAMLSFFMVFTKRFSDFLLEKCTYSIAVGKHNFGYEIFAEKCLDSFLLCNSTFLDELFALEDTLFFD